MLDTREETLRGNWIWKKDGAGDENVGFIAETVVNAVGWEKPLGSVSIERRMIRGQPWGTVAWRVGDKNQGELRRCSQWVGRLPRIIRPLKAK